MKVCGLVSTLVESELFMYASAQWLIPPWSTFSMRATRKISGWGQVTENTPCWDNENVRIEWFEYGTKNTFSQGSCWANVMFFSHVRDGNVALSVDLVQTNKFQQLLNVNVCNKIVCSHVPQRTNPTDFGEPLSFHLAFLSVFSLFWSICSFCFTRLTCLGYCMAASGTPWTNRCPSGWVSPPPFIYWLVVLGTMPLTDGWFKSTWKSEEIFLPFWMSNSDRVT